MNPMAEKNSSTSDFYVIEPCQTAKGIEIKLRAKRIDLKKAESGLSAMGGEPVGSSPVVLLVKMEGFALSIYASGRVMVKGNVRPGSGKADEVAKELVMKLERAGALV